MSLRPIFTWLIFSLEFLYRLFSLYSRRLGDIPSLLLTSETFVGSVFTLYVYLCILPFRSNSLLHSNGTHIKASVYTFSLLTGGDFT